MRVEPPLPDKRAREGVAAVLPGRGVVQRGVLYAFGQRDNYGTPPTASYLQGCLWPLYFGHVTVEACPGPSTPSTWCSRVGRLGCDERPNVKTDESTRLTHTGL